jgi:hypothetical protein
MKSFPFLPHVLVAVVVALPTGYGDWHSNAQETSWTAFDLSGAEIHLARALAEKGWHVPSNPQLPSERVVFIKIDPLPDAQAETMQRQVVVTHYRYQGDTTILTTVDVHQLEVLKVDVVPHHPTALADEELKRAERLARADLRLKHLFQARPIRVEGRPLQANGAQDPLFGHRVVHLLLQERGSYLSEPRVLVDLSNETVLVDPDF